MAKGVTVPGIVEAGFVVLAERGLDGMTMRLVADQLGVKAPAIYWHLKGKGDLLDEMATAMWREVMMHVDLAHAASAELGLNTFAHAVRSTLLRYRDGAKLFAGTYLTDPELLRRQESGLATMMAKGFDVRGAVLATSLVYSFTIGFTIEEQAVTQSQESGEDRYSLASRDRRVDAAQHPLAAQVGVELFANQEARFDELLEAAVSAAMSFRRGT